MIYEFSIRLPNGEMLRFRSHRQDHLERFETLWYEALECNRKWAEDGLRLAAEAGSLAAWWLLEGRGLYRPVFVGHEEMCPTYEGASCG